VLARLQRWAAELRAQVITLWFCRRHPGTPWAAKLVAAIVVAYALSPIDLIPDFIPVLGLLDDLILVPLGIALAIRLIPRPVWDDARRQADAWLAERRAKPRSHWAAAAIIAIWVALAGVAWRMLA
jgi:uncharacterized membrane protein YkvA (DUF1232 family)